MGRLGLVAGAGTWRLYLAPAAFLLVATIAIGLLRGPLRSHPHARQPARARVAKAPAAARQHRVYTVKAGDTIEAISVRTGVPQTRILSLNPKVSPTALFIGEKLRLG